MTAAGAAARAARAAVRSWNERSGSGAALTCFGGNAFLPTQTVFVLFERTLRGCRGRCGRGRRGADCAARFVGARPVVCGSVRARAERIHGGCIRRRGRGSRGRLDLCLALFWRWSTLAGDSHPQGDGGRGGCRRYEPVQRTAALPPWGRRSVVACPLAGLSGSPAWFATAQLSAPGTGGSQRHAPPRSGARRPTGCRRRARPAPRRRGNRRSADLVSEASGGAGVRSTGRDSFSLLHFLTASPSLKERSAPDFLHRRLSLRAPRRGRAGPRPR